MNFEEINPTGTIERLRALGGRVGLTDEMIQRQFFWLSCERRWSYDELGEELAALPVVPQIVVLDGINAAVSQHGGDVQRTESVGSYRKLLVAPAVSLGSTVLSLGHPVKDRTRQEERHTFGSTAWLDEVDGVGFRLEASQTMPISRGRYGTSALYSTKDRYGQVEIRGAIASTREPGWYYLGQFSIDSALGDIGEVKLSMPTGVADNSEGAVQLLEDYGITTASRDDLDDDQVYRAVVSLVDAGQQASARAVRAAAGIKFSRVRDALDRLVVVKKTLIQMSGDRGTQVYLYKADPPIVEA